MLLGKSVRKPRPRRKMSVELITCSSYKCVKMPRKKTPARPCRTKTKVLLHTTILVLSAWTIDFKLVVPIQRKKNYFSACGCTFLFSFCQVLLSLQHSFQKKAQRLQQRLHGNLQLLVLVVMAELPFPLTQLYHLLLAQKASIAHCFQRTDL